MVEWYAGKNSIKEKRTSRLHLKNEKPAFFTIHYHHYFQKVFHAPVNAITKLPVCDNSKNAWGVEMHFLLPLS